MLLDTHVLLWLLEDSPNLGPATRDRITRATTVFVSSVSHTELIIKSMLRRVTVPDGLAERLTQQGLQPLPYTDTHAAAVAHLPELVRHDPFDRMLLAQASVEGLAFATADARLMRLGLPWVVDAQE